MSKQTSFRSFAEAFSYLTSFTNLEQGKTTYSERLYRLDRMRTLLNLYGDPQASFRSIHVAGTKGKGSTAVFMASAIRAAGVRTGLYTSPHVSNPQERISVSANPPDDLHLTDIVARIRQTVESLGSGFLPGHPTPTTFELLTLLAFVYFKEVGCTHAVVETGIGGRLDATNVIHPTASVITPVDFDHTDVLGSSLQQIAYEKGGIIKPGVPVFCGRQPPCVMDVLRTLSRTRSAPIAFLEEELEHLQVHLSADQTLFGLRVSGMPLRRCRLRMLGDFQADNAGLAYLTLKRIWPWLPHACLLHGLESACLPGRMEIVSREPVVVLDGAHTPLAVRRLVDALDKVFPERGVLIFGAVTGKDHQEMARILAPCFATIIISTPGHFKESNPQSVYSVFRRLHSNAHLQESPSSALEQALASKLSPVLVTGSFYMVSEIRRLLLRT